MIKKYKFGEVSNEEIFARFEPTSSVEDIVSDIIKNVRANGDKALFEYCEKFDKAKLTSLGFIYSPFSLFSFSNICEIAFVTS